MKGVIRLGDATSHGGKVVSTSGTAYVNRIAVARQGDACVCPMITHTASSRKVIRWCSLMVSLSPLRGTKHRAERHSSHQFSQR